MRRTKPGAPAWVQHLACAALMAPLVIVCVYLVAVVITTMIVEPAFAAYASLLVN